jgi:hypothetical protein
VAKFTFVGAAPLYYTGSGLWAEPGKAYDLDTPPTDGNWVAEGASPVASQVAKADLIPAAPSPAEDAMHAAEALLEANPDLAAKIVKEAKGA